MKKSTFFQISNITWRSIKTFMDNLHESLNAVDLDMLINLCYSFVSCQMMQFKLLINPPVHAPELHWNLDQYIGSKTSNIRGLIAMSLRKLS